MAEIESQAAEPGPMNREPIGARGASPATHPALRLAATRVAHPGQPALDWLDRQLLDACQRDFPVCEAPFAEIASRLRRQANEVLRRLAELERCGVVRRVGPVFTPGRVDASTLVAMAVSRTRLDSIAEWVNRHHAVNHVYEREHEFNLWFVLAAPNAGELYETLADIRRRTGLDVLDLRLEQDYRIDIEFPPWRRPPSGRCPAAAGTYSPGRWPPLNASDLHLVEVIRDGLSLTARPYAVVADRVGLSEAQVMERLRRLLGEGVIKRMGVTVRHDALGYRANAMVAGWTSCSPKRPAASGARCCSAAAGSTGAALTTPRTICLSNRSDALCGCMRSCGPSGNRGADTGRPRPEHDHVHGAERRRGRDHVPPPGSTDSTRMPSSTGVRHAWRSTPSIRTRHS